MRGENGLRLMAAMAWAALALQLYLALEVRWNLGASLVGGLINVFSYFTVLSNTFAASVLSAAAWPHNTWAARCLRRPAVAGCAVISMLLVGIAYNLLLRQYWDPQGAQWLANEVLHNIMPLAMLGFWGWRVPKGHLRPAHVLAWALYPLGWYGFTLLRGASIGVWPYPFLDVTELGFARTFVNALGLLAGYCGGGLALVALDRYLGLRPLRPRRAASNPRP